MKLPCCQPLSFALARARSLVESNSLHLGYLRQRQRYGATPHVPCMRACRSCPFPPSKPRRAWPIRSSPKQPRGRPFSCTPGWTLNRPYSWPLSWPLSLSTGVSPPQCNVSPCFLPEPPFPNVLCTYQQHMTHGSMQNAAFHLKY